MAPSCKTASKQADATMKNTNTAEAAGRRINKKRSTKYAGKSKTRSNQKKEEEDADTLPDPDTVIMPAYRTAIETAKKLDKDIHTALWTTLQRYDNQVEKLEDKYGKNSDDPELQKARRMSDRGKKSIQEMIDRRQAMQPRLDRLEKLESEAQAKALAKDDAKSTGAFDPSASTDSTAPAVAPPQKKILPLPKKSLLFGGRGASSSQKSATGNNTPKMPAPTMSSAPKLSGSKRKTDSDPSPPPKKSKVNCAQSKTDNASKLTPSISPPNASSIQRAASPPCEPNCGKCGPCKRELEEHSKQKAREMIAGYSKFNYAAVMSQPKANHKVPPSVPAFGFAPPPAPMVPSALPPAPMVVTAPPSAQMVAPPAPMVASSSFKPAGSATNGNKKRKASDEADGRGVKKPRQDSRSPELISDIASASSSRRDSGVDATSSTSEERETPREVKQGSGTSGSPASTPSLSDTQSIGGDKPHVSQNSEVANDSDVKEPLDSTTSSTPSDSAISGAADDKGPACAND